MDCSPPCSSVHEILQARILAWLAISFSGAPEGKVRIGRLKYKGASGACSLSECSFCKALLTAGLFHCEPFRAHCTSDVNVLNMHPKDLSFGIDEIFLDAEKVLTMGLAKCSISSIYFLFL